MQFMGQKLSCNVPRHNINFYETYCDAILRTEDGSEFKVHRIILAQNEFFHALFSFEANATDILMKEIGSQTLRQILQYIYKGTLQLDEMNVLDLMTAADYMLMDDLMEQCRDFAIERIAPNNCLTLLTTAWKIERLNIHGECSRYVKVHFEDIAKRFPEEIGHLPLEVLKGLLNDNALMVRSEGTVLMAIVNWMKVDPCNRNRHLPDLLNYVRFEEIDHASRMVEDSTLLSIPSCMKALQVEKLIIKPSCLHRNANREPRLPKYLHVGGHISQSDTVIYLTCDEEPDFWRKIANVPWFPEVIMPIGKYIYLFNMNKNTAQRYDVLEDQLIPFPRAAGIYYCFVQQHGMICALGSYMDLFEIYNPSTEMWYVIESAGHSESNHWDICGAVSINGKLYAVGIIYDYVDYEMVHRSAMVTRVYHPKTNIWTTVASPRVLRDFCPAVAFQNRLYLIGGEKDHETSTSVEEYDPVIDAWRSLPDLPPSYDPMHAEVLDGTIMVFDNNPDFPVLRWDGGAWQKIESVTPIYSRGIVDDPSAVRELVKRSRRSTFQWERHLSVKI